MKSKKTLSIGIPAHNEEQNIAELLSSIQRQTQSNFILQKIFIICDNCTDGTEKIVKKLSKRDTRIIVFNDKKRKGKAQRLNQIYKLNQSDFLLTLDADIVLDNKDAIEQMVKTIESNDKILVVSSELVPIKASNWQELIGNAIFLLWQEVKLSFHDGNSIHNLDGACSLIKRELTKKMKYPKGLIADQGFLYYQATKEDSSGFKVSIKSKILFRPVNTFHDLRMQGARAIYGDKENLAKYCGKEIYELYKLPLEAKVVGIFRDFIHTPFLAIIALFFNVIIRIFPERDNSNHQGLWTTVSSTKKAIHV